MKILKWLGLGLAAVATCVLLVAFAARFGDGPLGAFPGGELVAGEWVDAVPSDWSFASDVQEMDLQLEEPLSSRRTWLVVHDGSLYVSCSFPNGLKRWPHHARKDGRAVLRLDGRLYRVELRYVADPKLANAAAKLRSAKYGLEVRDEADPDMIWFFEVRPRQG